MSTDAKRSPWTVPVLVLGSLLVLVAFAVFALRLYGDKMIIQIFTAAIKIRPGEKIPYDPKEYDVLVTILKDCQKDNLDPERMKIELPLIRAWLYRLGLKRLKVDKKIRDNLQTTLLARLKEMTHQSFGSDIAQWRKWQQTHDKASGQ